MLCMGEPFPQILFVIDDLFVFLRKIHRSEHGCADEST